MDYDRSQSGNLDAQSQAVAEGSSATASTDVAHDTTVLAMNAARIATMSRAGQSRSTAPLSRQHAISQWVFDLDGTISNPAAGMLDSINFALAREGGAQLTVGAIEQYIGPPLEETFAILAGSSDPALIDRMVINYRDHYRETGFTCNELYPGIATMLIEMHAAGLSLGVCTAKTSKIARKILAHFGLEDLFSFVSGGDIGVAKGDQLAQLLSDGVIDHAALMIGDRKYDLFAAHVNQLRSCAVSWGFGNRAELEAESPDFVVTNPAQLQELTGVATAATGNRAAGQGTI